MMHVVLVLVLVRVALIGLCLCRDIHAAFSVRAHPQSHPPRDELA
jgi:hypothetical protein